jgi:hypothetical protein
MVSAPLAYTLSIDEAAPGTTNLATGRTPWISNIPALPDLHAR